MKTLSTSKQIYFNPILKTHVLDEIKKDVRRNNDCVILIEGDEGSGKTALATSMAGYLDPEFSLDQVIFTPEQFFEVYPTLDKYKVILWDEGVTGFYGLDFMQNDQKKLVKMLTMARKRNLIFIMNIANIGMLSWYLAGHRARMLIEVYKQYGRYRGYYKFYNKYMTRKCYQMSKKYRNHMGVRPNFRGRFLKDSALENNTYFSVEDYESKKDAAIQSVVDNGGGDLWKERARSLAELVNQAKITQKMIASKWKVSREYVGQFLRGEN